MIGFTILATAAVALAHSHGHLRKFENLVVFGDSYSDESRLGYFFEHGGEAPPPGTLLPSSNSTSTGGYIWGRMVAKMTGAKLYDYAVSGATCSNEIISRYLEGIDAPFPSVADYEIPAYKADTAFKTLYPNRHADNTVYALWIGTNDLGYGAFLSDSQAPGTTISDFVECIWGVFDGIYETGGRHFVLLNQAPLELAPMYAAEKVGGAGNNQYWQNKTDYNQTEYQYKMLEYTTNVNTMFDYGVAFQMLAEDRWPGARFSIYDVHSLLLDIHDHPRRYLSHPANVDGFYHHCKAEDNSQCVDLDAPADSFLWYDELHPSERVDEVIAKNFVDVVHGHSKYGTYHTPR